MSVILSGSHSNLRDIVLNLHREIFERGKQYAVLQGNYTHEKRKSSQLTKDKAQLQRDVMRYRSQVDEISKERDALAEEVKALKGVRKQVEALTEEVEKLRKVRRHAVEVETLQQTIDALQEEKNKVDAEKVKLAEEIEMTKRKLSGTDYLCKSFKERVMSSRKVITDIQALLKAMTVVLDSWDLCDGTDASNISSTTLFMFNQPETEELTHRLFAHLITPVDTPYLHELYRVEPSFDLTERARRRALDSGSTLTSPNSPLWILVREGLCRFWRTTPWQLLAIQPVQLMVLTSLFLEHHAHHHAHTLPAQLEEIRNAIGLASFEEMDGEVGPPTERIGRLIHGVRTGMLDHGTPWSRRVEVRVDRSVVFTEEELMWLEADGMYLFKDREGGLTLRSIHEPHRRLIRPARVCSLLDDLYGFNDPDVIYTPPLATATADHEQPPPATTSNLLLTLRTFVGDSIKRFIPRTISPQSEIEILGRLSQQLMTTAPHLAIMDFTVARRTSALTKHHQSMLQYAREKIQEAVQLATTADAPTVIAIGGGSGTTASPIPLPSGLTSGPTSSTGSSTGSGSTSGCGSVPIRMAVDVLINQNLYPCIYVPSAIRVAIIRDNLNGPISPTSGGAVSLQISRVVRFRIFVTMHDRPDLTSLQTMQDWQEIMDATAEQVECMSSASGASGASSMSSASSMGGAAADDHGDDGNALTCKLAGNARRFVFGYGQSVSMGFRIHVFAACPRGTLVSFNMREAIDDIALLAQVCVAGMVGLVAPRSITYKKFVKGIVADDVRLAELGKETESHIHYFKEQLHDGITAALRHDMISAFA